MTDDDADDESGNGHDPGVPEEEPLGDLADEVRTDDSSERSDEDETTGEGRRGPLSDVASELDAEADAPGDRPGDELFEEAEDVGEIDREALWRQVAGEEAASKVEEVQSEVEDGPREPTVKADPATADGVSVEDRTIRVVDKAKYCHSCEHFSPPPQVRCTHEGTDILEMVDVERFRVADCPVVAEDEELENV